jgi:hypothetical protein
VEAVGTYEARNNSVNEGFHQRGTCADCRSGCLHGVSNIAVGSNVL